MATRFLIAVCLALSTGAANAGPAEALKTPAEISSGTETAIKSLINGNIKAYTPEYTTPNLKLRNPIAGYPFKKNTYEDINGRTLVGSFLQLKNGPLVTNNAQSFQLSVSSLPYVSGYPDLTEMIYNRSLQINGSAYTALAPIPAPEAATVVADAFKKGKGAVLLSGAGLFVSLVSRACTNVNSDLVGALGSFFRFTQLLASLAIEKFGADPRLGMWVKLCLNGTIPSGITITSLNESLASEGFVTYNVSSDFTAIRAATLKLYPDALAPVPTSIAPLAANAASLVEQSLAFVATDKYPSVQVTLARLVETYLMQAQTNQSRELVAPYRQLAAAAKGVMTSDYDIFVEQILNRTGLDFTEVQYGAGLIDKPNPAAAFWQSNAQSEYVVHFHGSYYNKGVMVYSLGSYEQTAPETVRFLFNTASTYSFVFVGTAGGIFDPHFLLTFLQLYQAKSTQKHYLLLVGGEVNGIQGLFKDLGGLGQYMSSVMQIIVYAPDFGFGDLSKFLQSVADKILPNPAQQQV